MVRLSPNRHLPLLHRLEESTLDFGGGSIDLIRQNQVGKNRPLMNTERSLFGLKDHRPHHIARQKIRSKLDPLEIETHGRAQAFNQKCLC